MTEKYEPLHFRSINDPESFWGEQAAKLDWFTPWQKVLDDSNPPFYRWFVGGKTNLCHNAVDRHALGAGRNKAAIIWESPETGQSRVMTFFELYREVNRFAHVLKKYGVGRGDRVMIYMPMVPEALVAVLGCARVGAIHAVVFAGFSADSLAGRIDDCEPKMVVCAEASRRKGKPVPLKKIVDQALANAKHQVAHTLVLDRGLDGWDRKDSDLDWATEMAAAPNTVVPPEAMESTEPSYILYTSGTTGKPKGVLRDTGGYMVALHASMSQIYGCGPSDVYWSTSDIGWVVGHSYIIYGPLLAGIPTVLFEGTPDSPDPGIWWRVVEKYGVSVMFSAPTAMRILRKFPMDWIRKADISSLRHVFLAGEPLDESTYQWTVDTLRIPIVDHYWQTESGWAILTNHMGIETLPFKPGSPTRGAMGWNLAVVDEKGDEMPAGDKGVLIIKPPLPPGALLTIWGDDARYVETYWRKLNGNEPAVYFSGDFAIRDADGYFWMLGRADEVINVAGHRMGTREVEEVLSEHPKVAEASAIGIADELKGQAIAAFVVLKAGVEPTEEIKKELVQSIRNSIGAIATPKTLEIVAGLPKTRSGKVMRRVLKALCEEKSLGDLSTMEDGASVEEIRTALEKMGRA